MRARPHVVVVLALVGCASAPPESLPVGTAPVATRAPPPPAPGLALPGRVTFTTSLEPDPSPPGDATPSFKAGDSVYASITLDRPLAEVRLGDDTTYTLTVDAGGRPSAR